MNNKQSPLYLVLAVIIFVVLTYTISNYFSREYSSLVERRTDLQQELAVKQGYLATDDIEELAADFGQMIPPQKQKSELTTEISQLARQSGLQIASIKFVENEPRSVISTSDDTEEDEQIQELFTRSYKSDNLTIQVNGNESAVKDFLNRLYQENRIIDITHVTYSVIPQSNGTVNGTIVSNIYYQ